MSEALTLDCMRCGKSDRFFGTNAEAWDAAVALGWRMTRLLTPKCGECAGRLTAREAADWILCRSRSTFKYAFMTIAPPGAFYGAYLLVRDLWAWLCS